MTNPPRYDVTRYTPPAHEPGSALAALSPQMQAWVIAKVQQGVTNREAARIAGYAGNNHVLDGVGYRCAHDPRVQAALFEQATLAMRASSAVAIRVVEEILIDANAERKDRLRAAEMILSRTGFNSVSEQRITVDRQTEAQKVAEIVALSRRLGIDPAALLGPEVTDAEFEVVEGASDEFAIQPWECAHGE
jgi:hypothetical protein